MRFLLRMAFWLGLVLVLLPRDQTPESGKLPQVGTSEAVQAATAAVGDEDGGGLAAVPAGVTCTCAVQLAPGATTVPGMQPAMCAN